MRVSTAIALGRMTVPKWAATKLRGCALGMAGNAAGVKNQWTGGTAFNYDDLERTWPWLRLPAKECPVGGCQYGNIIDDSNMMLIAHIFDTHVVGPGARHPWTLDQLIDFVRSIEPKEEDASEARNKQHPEVAVCTHPGVLSHSRHRGS